MSEKSASGFSNRKKRNTDSSFTTTRRQAVEFVRNEVLQDWCDDEKTTKLTKALKRRVYELKVKKL